jgi:hypothetical protein
VKTPHHTSYNGWNETLHQTTLSTPLLVNSGGSSDPDHPEPQTLKMLKVNSAGHTFLRNDRNGLIEIQPDGTKLKFTTAKPGTNDFSPNGGPDLAPSRTEAAVVSTTSSASASGDVVRVHAEIPNRRTRVTITVDIDPGASGSPIDVPSGVKKK